MAPSDTPRDPESMIGLPSPLLDIQSRTFATSRRGYDRAEVDAFLKRLGETISGLLEERTVLSADAGTELDPEAIAESTMILEDAEARASRRLHAATLEADRLRTEARRTLDKAIKEAQEVENAARANAEQMTAEATEMRQQILRDLLRRRKEAQMHVEMLRAARDELMNVFDQVRRITAQVKDPLDSALDRAKQAADIAAKRTQEEPQESLTQFEAELQTARLSGVIPIPVETEREAVLEEAVLEEAGLGEAVLADEGVVRMEPSQSVAEEARSKSLEPEPLESKPTVEPAEEQAGEHGKEALLQTDEPELENIFARLRESAAQPESVAEDQASDNQASDDQVSAEQASADETSDAQIEEMKRQIKRALTSDESKVLQAIHRLHKKAPKKAEELRSVLADQEDRTGEFAQLLPAPSHDIQSLLIAPLAASLSACDIEEADTKALVQQVRDVYRSFSQEQIAPIAAELAKRALEN